MQADETSADYISRAKAKLVAWNEARNEADKASRFDRCAAAELIAVAETGRNLDGTKLSTGDRGALYGAWQSVFGEPLGTRSGAVSVTDGVTEPPASEHPLLSVPDDMMLRPRDVTRLCGVSRTTLKRWRRAGRFPQPLRSAPHTNHVGWPARQVKAWFRAATS